MTTKILFTVLSFLIISTNAKAQSEAVAKESYNLDFDKIDSSRFFNRASIQILDKTTAKSIDADIRVGEAFVFGNIKIKVLKCWQAPLDQEPDSRILIEVFEKRQILGKKAAKNEKDEKENRIFFGWMIASSPSVSSLEHPVYDIVALNCKK